MIKTSVIILLALFAAHMQSFSFDNEGIRTVKIKCEKIHCEGCKNTITEALQTVEGVAKIDINMKTKIIKVTFDNKKTTKQKISEKILEAGYENQIIS